MEYGPTRDDILTWAKNKGKRGLYEFSSQIVVKSSNGSYICDVI